MSLRICYDCSADVVLHDPEWSKKARLLRSAGVSRMWLFGYFYGNWNADPESIARAKRVLEDDGFEVQAINVPFGHGGNALDPNDPNFKSDIGQGWRETWNRAGLRCANTTCPNEKAIADTRDSLQVLKQIGMSEIFFDDDLRLGQWGPQTQGCFCPECRKRFAERYGAFSVDDLDCDGALTAAWKRFQCENLTDFVQQISVDGMRIGVMVMHNGDERHGVDIDMLKARIPGVFFRVGEGHFDDAAFTHPIGEASIRRSIGNHMARIGDNTDTWSESTLFPEYALSPENLVRRMKLALRTGLKNLYIMSGTIFLSEPYWTCMAQSLSELRQIEAQVGGVTPDTGDWIWQI